jgi:hypothetical protein
VLGAVLVIVLFNQSPPRLPIGPAQEVYAALESRDIVILMVDAARQSENDPGRKPSKRAEQESAEDTFVLQLIQNPDRPVLRDVGYHRGSFKSSRDQACGIPHLVTARDMGHPGCGRKWVYGAGSARATWLTGRACQSFCIDSSASPGSSTT